jgi:hypothetical protein
MIYQFGAGYARLQSPRALSKVQPPMKIMHHLSIPTQLEHRGISATRHGHQRAIMPQALAMYCLGMVLSCEVAGQIVAPAPASSTPLPPELAALDAQYSKLQRERVTTPYETEVTKLNDKYREQLDQAWKMSIGRGAEQVAFQKERDRLRNKQPMPETDAQNTPVTLVNLRATYRKAKNTLDAKRAADLKFVVDPLARRLTQMTTDLARAGREADAKTVQEYHDALVKLPGAFVPATGSPTLNVPLAATVTSEDRNIDRILEDVIFPDWQTKSIFARWDFLPTLQVRSDDPELSQHAEALFAKLCHESGLTPEAGERIIDVYIGRSEKMKDLIAREPVKTRNESTCLVYWDETHALKRSAVFLSTNNFATKNDAKASLCRNMIGAFGLGGRTRELKAEDQSVFSEQFSNVQTMSPFDCKVLTFLYRYIPAGTTKPDARRIFRKEWKP